MGNSFSDNHSLSSDMRASTKMRLPIPDKEELEKRFNKVLAMMDLPPDKERAMRQFDDDKKWDIICDQELVGARDPPSYYLDKLKAHMTMKGSKNKKLIGSQTSTQVLRDLEISLRTNNIQWVRDFLNEENRGLDVLVSYLSFTQMLMQSTQEENGDMTFSRAVSDMSNKKTLTLANSPNVHTKVKRTKSMPPNKRPTNKQLKSRKVGDAFDDVHICIMCLRAIMNHQHGFNLVIAHADAINNVALALKHHSMRTRTLVLELLAAVCLVSGGHEIILRAFDNFKIVTNENKRFETLLYYFEHEDFHIDFMVACTQFMNIIVHSVENVNYRVHLQYELTALGLDDILESLKDNESERLITQVQAYTDNRLDVGQLLEDSEQKAAAVERAETLDEELSQTTERLQEVENETVSKLAELQMQINEKNKTIDLLQTNVKSNEDTISTLKRSMDEREGTLKKKSSEMELLKAEVETLKRTGSVKSSSGPATIAAPAPPVPGPPPPPPPPAPGMGGPPPPPPPPPPGMGGPPPPPPGPGAPPPPPPGPGGLLSAVPAKRKIATKYKLPSLNWVALKPGQVKGTVFCEIDDEKILKSVNFAQFEEDFKLGINRPQTEQTDGSGTPSSKKLKKPDFISLMDANRNRNAAIARKKLQLSDQDIVSAITTLNLHALNSEYIDLLLHIIPNEQEVKAFNNYEASNKPISALSPTDQFMMQLNRVEKIQQKLNIMNYIATFRENVKHMKPQTSSLLTASISIKNSKKLRKILEIVLAFGNYMNSQRRGGVYGFRLQSLDVLSDTKSTDKRITLLHYIVATVQDLYPELHNFSQELDYIEKAALVSLENLQIDIAELEKGMTMIKKEYDARTQKSKDTNSMTQATKVLKEFIESTQGDLTSTRKDCSDAVEAYNTTVEYFGETAKTTNPQTFFGIFVRFCASYKQALKENETRQKLEMAQQKQEMAAAAKSQKAQASATAQAAMMNELKSKVSGGRPKDTRKIGKDEIYHGALEDILTDLKKKPYIRSDGARRSQKRQPVNGNLVAVGNSERL